MALHWKVEDGELTASGEYVRVICASGFILRVETAKMNDDMLVLRLRAPTLSILSPVHANETTYAWTVDLFVVCVLADGSRSEVKPPVVETISIPVVYVYGAFSEKKPMHERACLNVVGLSSGEGVERVSAGHEAPAKPGNKISVGAINEREHSSRKRYGHHARAVYDQCAGLRLTHRSFSEVGRSDYESERPAHSTVGGA